MSIKCIDIMEYIESIAPACLAESYDNVGLIIGGRNNAVDCIMVCLDVTSDVVDEAVKNHVDLIVSHHPLIFKGLKTIDSESFRGRVIYKLIKNGISVYSAHTNLDVAENGLNSYLAQILQLENVENLNPYRHEKLFKLAVFVPRDHIDRVRNAVCEAGAGWIGNYSDCTFAAPGTGTFKPLEGTNPYIGSKGKLELTDEFKLETVVPSNLLKGVVNSMLEAHPYEEVAYDIYPLELNGTEYGLGKVGSLKNALSQENLVSMVKERLNIDNVRVIGSFKGMAGKIAVFCGSFDDNLYSIKKKNVEVLITGDIKYHTAVEAVEMGLCIIDAGHYGTEKAVVPFLKELLSEKFKDTKVICNSVEKDPFKYI